MIIHERYANVKICRAIEIIKPSINISAIQDSVVQSK